jgi:hypothetical protein
LQYTEYFGNGDSKAYNEVENAYENIHVEKKECVGHVQKRVGTALWKLKKERKKDVLEFGAYDAVAHFNIVPRLQQKSLMNLVWCQGNFLNTGLGKLTRDG